MNDADSRRHDAKTVKRLRSPFQKAIALFVALEFDFHIALISRFAARVINLNRVVDHQINRHERFDHARRLCPFAATAERIAAKSTSSGTPVKSCKITRATVNGISSVRSPSALQLASARTSFFAQLFSVVEISQNRFQHDANRNRQTRNCADAFFFELRQRIKNAVRARRLF